MSTQQPPPGRDSRPDQHGQPGTTQQPAQHLPGTLPDRTSTWGTELEERFPDPGLPEHVHRISDTDPKAARRAERQVSLLFLLSVVGTALFVVGYFAFPLPGSKDDIKWSNVTLGLGLAIAMFSIGAAAIQWAKKLMPDEEVAEERHAIRSSDEERREAARILREGGEAAGFGRRKMVFGSMGAAMGALAIPAILPLKDLWIRDRGVKPYEQISKTAWKAGVRLVKDPTGEPVRAASIPVGGVVHVLPEAPAGDNADSDEPKDAETEGTRQQLSLEERAKSAVLVMRLEPGVVEDRADRRGWDYEGIYAFSKICTHVGCPVGLYEQQTHHLLCPCHQSTFDVTRHCDVIFGPAARALPQLAITVDADGYLVAKQGFQEPVGPSFWERG